MLHLFSAVILLIFLAMALADKDHKACKPVRKGNDKQLLDALKGVKGIYRR